MCAVKRFIVINCIQNKSFCLHNICTSTVFIYYVYLNTQTFSIYLENIYIYIFILYILYINIFNIQTHFFLNIYMDVFVFIFTFT